MEMTYRGRGQKGSGMGLLRVREWSQEAEGFELLLARNVALCFVDRIVYQ